MAVLGIYGVMAYRVSLRTNEIGIRIALGARNSQIIRLVIGQGMALVVIGLLLGVSSAYLDTTLLEKLV